MDVNPSITNNPSDDDPVVLLPPNTPMHKFPLKPLLFGFLFMIAVASAVFGLYMTQKGGFSLFNKAAEQGKLICMPIDTSGNAIDNSVGYNRIKVINNTGETVHVQWGHTFCPVSQWTSTPPPICKDNQSIYAEVLAPGAEKIFEMNVACETYGQLDVWQNPDTSFNPITEKNQRINGAECFNSLKNAFWNTAYEGGPSIAYTFAKNEQACSAVTPTPTIPATVCSTLTAVKVNGADLSNLTAGETVRFTITAVGTKTVESAAVRLLKNGEKVADLICTKQADSRWTVDLTVPAGSEGSYEALGFIKVDGVWK